MAIASPLDISGLVAWYSAEAETSFADGTMVTTWHDQSGLGNDAVVTGSSDGLTMRKTAGPGGTPAIEFNGVGSSSSAAYYTLPNIFSGATSVEAFFVIKAKAAIRYNGFNAFDVGGDNSHYFYDFSTTYDKFASTLRRSFIPTLSPTDWRRYHTQSGTSWSADLDGVSQLVDPSNTVQLRAAPLIGAGGGIGSWRFGGFMSTVLLYNRTLTPTERSDLDDWLVAGFSVPPVDADGAGSGESDAGAEEGTAASILATGGASGESDAAAGVVSILINATGAASAESNATGAAQPLNVGVTQNRVGGRHRSGIGEIDWEPPVVDPPLGPVLLKPQVVAHSFSVPTINGTMPSYDVNQVTAQDHIDRILIGSKDVTFFRGVPTPFPGFSLVEPLMYGPTSISFPQIVAAFEKPGVGALKWLKPFAPVVIQRVNPTTKEVVSTDYRGLVIGFDMRGDSVTVQVGGEAQARAAMQNQQVPIFPTTQDLGLFAFYAIKHLGLKCQPYLGPETGIVALGFGGSTMLDYINQIVNMSWTRSGNRWTIMPTKKGVYQMRRKDTTTIAGTVYADDQRTVADLSRDLSEEPNRIFMTGVTPEGQRVRFGSYPGLKQTDPPPYPFNDGRSFGEGTTNADTNTGDGISVMLGRLRVMGYVTAEDSRGGFDADATRAVNALKEDAGLLQNGQMNPDAWNALYDLDVTGFSLRWSRILPAAEKPRVKQWRRSASGSVMSRNPNYDPTYPKVDRNVDAGTGFERSQLREWADAELDQASEDNWTGTISFNTGALVKGIHVPGTPLDDNSDSFRARDLRPGMNLWLPLFDGGTTVHVSEVTTSADGSVTATVDTRARDALEVWEVITRNRESRRSPYREWVNEQRQSQQVKDTIVIWDEVGGFLGDDITLKGNAWTVFPVVAGQEGTIARLRVRTSPSAEFVMAVFGRKISPARLSGSIGNPLTKAGAKKWETETTRDQFTDRYLMLYVAGSNEEPLGYYPKSKTKKGDQIGTSGGEPVFAPAAPLTGRWQDDASFGYRTTSNAPVLWVAVWSDRNTKIPRGQIMWNQLESGT